MDDTSRPSEEPDGTLNSVEPEKASRKKDRGEKPEKLTRKERIRRKREERSKTVKLFPANRKGYHIMHFMNFLRFLFYPIHSTLLPFRMYGNKKVGKGACIYFGNHYTIFDIFYPAHTSREGIHFLSKQSVLEAPILSYWGYKIGAIGAMRDGSDVRTLMNAMRALKNGEKISLFPEGTRNKTGGDDFLPFYGGAALMAIKTKSPIIPFVICSKPKLLHITHIVFGDPIELTEYYDKKLTGEDYEKIDNMLRDKLYEIRAEHRAMIAAKKEKKRRKKCKSS